MVIIVILGILSLIVLAYIGIALASIFNLLIKIAGDVSSIQDYQSKEYAKKVANEMKKKGYVMTEAGKELLKANTGK